MKEENLNWIQLFKFFNWKVFQQGPGSSLGQVRWESCPWSLQTCPGYHILDNVTEPGRYLCFGEGTGLDDLLRSLPTKFC